MKVIILDYGVGNLGSVYKFFNLFDSLKVVIEKDLNSLKSSNILIIPGVGSFGYGCKNLRRRMVYPDQINDFAINGGLLKQNKNLVKINNNIIKCVSIKKPTTKEKNDLIFALKVCKHVKSNAIVLVKNMQTVGIGAGQMSRIDSTKIALLKSDKKIKEKGFVAASDAFFPFNDAVKLLINNNCKSIVQPRGSINDKKVIDVYLGRPED